MKEKMSKTQLLRCDHLIIKQLAGSQIYRQGVKITCKDWIKYYVTGDWLNPLPELWPARKAQKYEVNFSESVKNAETQQLLNKNHTVKLQIVPRNIWKQILCMDEMRVILDFYCTIKVDSEHAYSCCKFLHRKQEEVCNIQIGHDILIKLNNTLFIPKWEINFTA